MACTNGTIVDLLDDSGSLVIVQQGESLNISGTLTDFDGAAIALAAIATFTLTLYNDATNAVINGLNAADILNAGKGTVDAAGGFVIRLDAADTPIVDGTLAEKALEVHIARLTWTWNDGVGTRTGIQEVRHRVQKLDAAA